MILAMCNLLMILAKECQNSIWLIVAEYEMIF